MFMEVVVGWVLGIFFGYAGYVFTCWLKGDIDEN